MKYLKIILITVLILSFVSYALSESRTTGLISSGVAVILTLIYMYLEKKEGGK